MKREHYQIAAASHPPLRETEETHNPKEIDPSPLNQVLEMTPNWRT
jgi:hypothetical protein